MNDGDVLHFVTAEEVGGYQLLDLGLGLGLRFFLRLLFVIFGFSVMKRHGIIFVRRLHVAKFWIK